MTKQEELQVQESIEKAGKVREEIGLLAGRRNNKEQSVSEETFDVTKEKFSKLLDDFITDFPHTSTSIARTISQLTIILDDILPVLEYDKKHGWLALRHIMMLQVDSLLHGMAHDLEKNDITQNTGSNILDTLNDNNKKIEKQEPAILHDQVKINEIYTNDQIVDILSKCGLTYDRIMVDFKELGLTGFQFKFTKPTLNKYSDCLEMNIINDGESVKRYYLNDKGFITFRAW